MLLVGCAQQSTAQAAPGVFADANQPSGPPDPEKLDQVWQVDPISGQVTIKIPFGTTPVGGRGPKIPFSLSYNSASTITLQSSSVNLSADYYQGNGSEVIYQWATGPFNTSYGPAGPWVTSGPYMYNSQTTIPNQGYTTSVGVQQWYGYGCTNYGPYIYTDENGDSHDMNLQNTTATTGSEGDNYYAVPCQQLVYNGSPSTTSDGSALYTSFGGAVSPDGTSYSNNTFQLEDTNGNKASNRTDSLGRTPFSTNIPVAGPPGGQIPVGTYYVTTTGTTGNSESYSVVFSKIAIGSFTMPHPTSSEITQNAWCLNGLTCPIEIAVAPATPGSSLPAVTSISLPDDTSAYTFQYDPTYGTISQINFPDGGYVRFVWGIQANSGGYGQFGEVSSIVVTDAYTATGAGAAENHWQYNIPSVVPGQAASSTVTAPDGSYTSYIGVGLYPFSTVGLFSNGAKGTTKEASRTIYSARGAPMKSIAKNFNSQGLTLQEATSLYDGPQPLQQLTQFTYDSYSNVIEKDESDFYVCGSNPCAIPAQNASLPAPSAGWLRRTYTTYEYSSNPAWVTAHIVNKPSQVLVTNGNGTPVSLTTYTYDQAGYIGSTPTGLSTHDDTNYGPGATLPRGNLTTESRCITFSGSGSSATCATSWNTSYVYDLTGQLTQKIEGSGTLANATTIYTWGGQLDGFLQSVQHPNGATDSYTYYTPTGQVKTHVDWNGNTTTYGYVDPLNRIKSVQLPATTDGTTGSTGNGTTTYNYTDTPGAFTVQEQHTVTAGVTTSVTTTYDGLGRKANTSTQVPTSQCSAGVIQVVTSYDEMSRVSSVKNPYCSASDSTYGSTQFAYDALGRKIQTTLPDGSISTIEYAGNATETTDPPNGTTSVQHIQQADGLGRLTNVCEVTSTSLGSGSPAACGLNITGVGYLTTYTYDSLGNMLAVNQHGLSRSFTYDGISRLLTSLNPEVGQDTYTYPVQTPPNCPPGSGHCIPPPVPCAPNEAVPCTRQDARGVVTNYQYDSMSRLIGKWYSIASTNTTGTISDLSSCYQYDHKLTSSTDANPLGQLTFEWQQPGQCPNSTTSPVASPPSNAVALRIRSQHDAMGRVGQDQQCLTASGCPSSTIGNFAYSYNLLGNPVQSNNGIETTAVSATETDHTNTTAITAPSVTWKATYDLADHINNVAVQDQPSVLPTGTYLADPTLLNPTNYDPFGHMTAAQIGTSYGSTTPAISQTRQYDDRGRILYEVDNGTGATSSAQHSLGTITITGGEQGPTYPASSFAKATATIGGTEQDDTFNVCPGAPSPCNETIPDAGTVTLTVNGTSVSTNYGMGITTAIIATALAGKVNSAGLPVIATVSGSTITLRSTTPGTAGNNTTISSSSATTVTPYYTSPSFTISNSAFAGGTNGTANTYDSGTVSATVNGITASVSFGSTSTPQTVASALATAIQGASGSAVTAKSDGDLNVLVSSATGTSTDYTVTTAVTYDTTDFSKPSFMATAFTMQDGGAADVSDGMIYYYYVPNGGYAPNGNILAHSDMIMGDWIFTYDAVDRLTSAVPSYTTQSQYSGKIGCWTHDAYGNRTMEAFSTAACNANPTPQVLTTYNAANSQVVNSTVSPNTVSGVGTFIYDASGNTLYDGNNRYWYDAEGQLCAAQSQRSTGAPVIQYVYDAEGARIGKGTLTAAPSSYTATCAPPLGSGFTLTNRYLVDLGGDQVTELTGAVGSQNWAHSNVWAAGKLSATWDTKGLHFELDDPLGTKRVQASASGLVEETCTSLPYGNDVGNPIGTNCAETGVSTADDATEHHFTQKERDTESGNDYFEARYYSSAMGRFMSPDWSAKVEPVPYASMDDPQSLNLYAYVRNNPLTRVDADGHCVEDLCIGEGGAAVVAVAVIGTIALEAGAQAYNNSSDGQRSLSTFTSAVSDSFSSNVTSLKNTVTGWFSKSKTAQAKSTPAVPPAAQSTPGLPKPPTGPGKVPKDQRDKKRAWTKKENASKLEQQGGKCAQCGDSIEKGDGHHIDRHADGAPTNDANHAVVCHDCHVELHKPGN